MFNLFEKTILHELAKDRNVNLDVAGVDELLPVIQASIKVLADEIRYAQEEFLLETFRKRLLPSIRSINYELESMSKNINQETLNKLKKAGKEEQQSIKTDGKILKISVDTALNLTQQAETKLLIAFDIFKKEDKESPRGKDSVEYSEGKVEKLIQCAMHLKDAHDQLDV